MSFGAEAFHWTTGHAARRSASGAIRLSFWQDSTSVDAQHKVSIAANARASLGVRYRIARLQRGLSTTTVTPRLLGTRRFHS